MTTDIERWRREGGRPATIERTEMEVTALQSAISDLWKQYLEGQVNRLRNNRKRRGASGRVVSIPLGAAENRALGTA